MRSLTKHNGALLNGKRKTENGKLHMMIIVLVVSFSTFHFPLSTSASQYYPELLFRYDHHLFALNPNEYPAWRKTEEVWSYKGAEISPPQVLRVDGDDVPGLPEGITRSLRSAWNSDAIAATISARISIVIDRPRGEVTMRRVDDNIEFEGVGFLGKEVDTERTAQLVIDALERGLTDIHLPVTERQPIIHVLDSDLQDIGIREVIAIGESNFSRSATARRHNISAGLSKFNGHLILQGETFSFNKVLGPVNAKTGYVKELVILGDKTLPDYGGGLCQVSTTAYRGIWEYGYPITDRRNHSFAVSYYSPQGTDATIYPPYTDLKFLNDGPSAILIQTYYEGDRAFFIYYGMRDTREVEIIGPYVWDRREPPPDKTEYTTDIPPGTERIAGKAVPGMQSAWFRVTRSEDGFENIEPFYSYYEARPNFTQIGAALEPIEPVIGLDSDDLLDSRNKRLTRRRNSARR
ncbi:MAG: VanW family protein [Candidatus Peribacteraceae bacterium]|jgi:vancomycin resistance protein YoaR|nr:VanW family protein [Candidatus Peribacteraceae bacterium]